MGKKSVKILFLLCFLGFGMFVSASPCYFYPNHYEVVIHSLKEKDIQKIEVIYEGEHSFVYEDDEEFRTWIEFTDFGYKYKNYKDSEIIPKLKTEEIDKIAQLYLNTKEVANEKGYWIEDSVIDGRHGSIAKFLINDNTKVKYFDDDVLVTYQSDEINNVLINRMYLRIELKDGSVVYSDQLASSKEKIVDEYSSDKEWKKAESIQKETAYFEIDFSKDGDLLVVSEKEKAATIAAQSHNGILIVLGCVLGFVVILAGLLLILSHKKVEK